MCRYDLLAAAAAPEETFKGKMFMCVGMHETVKQAPLYRDSFLM